ncbi:hypothetical protein M422DRAFT_70397 [Sphaerobolus stellatus SS14]|uniref:Non-reducing end alpha-L-arabinofuranosidase n=1 Tax=Sphaerobolus stellatus (strain SS14) TaxID=990650 RepID=A0A0C9V8E1_SPHS4|nr:hypothetical protein M422DRAFT_70397 [Sphaerobolus stellatus SS14]
MDSNWNTLNNGSEITTSPTLSASGRIWLRVAADTHAISSSQGIFSYGTDGNSFTNLVPGFIMDTSWKFFIGYRYVILNYATSALGGSVTVSLFTLSTLRYFPPSKYT